MNKKLVVVVLIFSFYLSLSQSSCINYRFQKISSTEGNFTGTLDNSDYLGTRLSSISDLNGDGINELVAQSFGDDDGGVNTGALWIIFLDTNGIVYSQQKISDTYGNFNGSISSGCGFGTSIDDIGDLDNDGIPDLAVGAMYEDDGGLNKGALWILFMNANGTVKAEQKISETSGNFTGNLSPTSGFGGGVCNIGDFDGDGISDIVIGATRDDVGNGETGSIFLTYMNANGTVKSSIKITQGVNGFSGNLSPDDVFAVPQNIGDLNNDGINDIAVAAPFDDDGGNNCGALWILFMNANGTVQNHQKISNSTGFLDFTIAPETRLGYMQLDNLGDLDGDGNDEILISASGDDQDGTNRGSAYIFHLNSNGTVNYTERVNNLVSGFNSQLDNVDYFGHGVCSLGDLDNNGLTDFAVSANWDDDGGLNKGAIYVFFRDDCNSGSSCNTTAQFSTTDSIICVNSTLSFNNSSTGATSYEWLINGSSFSSNTNSMYLFDSAGTFQITLIANDGQCNDYDTLQINVKSLPEVTINNDTTICNFDTILLFVSGGNNYQWSPNINISCTNCPSPSVYPSFDQTYYVSITDSNNCTQNDSIHISITCCNGGLINPMSSFSISDTILCKNDSIKLINQSIASSNASYYWDFGNLASTQFSLLENPPSISYLQAGNYTVTLIVNDSCSNDTSTQDILIIQNPNAIAGNDTTLCEIEYLQLGTNSNPNYKYLWSPADGLSNDTVSNPISIAENTISYNLTVIDPSTGCIGVDNIKISIIDAPIAFAGNDTSIIQNGSIQLTGCCGNNIYNWEPKTFLSEPTVQNPISTPLDNIEYYLTVTNEYGCSSVDSIFIDIINNNTLIPNIFTPNNDNYNKTFEIHGITEPYSLTIYNRWGKQVYHQSDYKNDWDGEGLSDGVYFYKIDDGFDIFKGWVQIIR